MPNNNTKLALRQLGFYFGKGEIFSSPAAAAATKTILFDDATSETAPALKARAAPRLQSLFETLLDYRGLHVAIRGRDLFFETIANNYGGAPIDVTPDQVKEITAVYGKARRDNYGDDEATPLSKAVDQWNALVEETASLPSNQGQIQLSVRTNPTDMVALSNTMGSLTTGPQEETTPQVWPPQYLAAEDLAFLGKKAVHQALQGVTMWTPGGAPAIATVLSHPMVARSFLGWVILAKPSATGALYPAPIAHMAESSRRHWMTAMGKSSYLFSSLDGFLDYARVAFLSRDKRLVAGLLTPWFLTMGQAQSLSGSASASAGSDHWLGAAAAARMGLALVLRLLPGPSGGVSVSGVQVVLFDPWPRYHRCREAVKAHGTAVFRFRGDLDAKITSWCKHWLGLSVLECWWGGVLPGGIVSGDDSVSLSAAFLVGVSEGELLPAVGAGEQEWARMGFEKGRSA